MANIESDDICVELRRLLEKLHAQKVALMQIRRFRPIGVFLLDNSKMQQKILPSPVSKLELLCTYIPTL